MADITIIYLNELVVEIDNSNVERDGEMLNLQQLSGRCESAKAILQTTRVGTFDPLPGYESGRCSSYKYMVDTDLL